MPYSSLGDFLEELTERDQLARVSVEVEPMLEIAEIARRVVRVGGPALLFDHVRGHGCAVVANLLAAENRACRALGIGSLDELAERTEALIEKHTPQNWFDRLKTSADEAGANKFRPKTVKAGPCQQVVRLGRDIDLASLPLPEPSADACESAAVGRLITTEHGGETRRVSICPVARVDRERLAVVDDGQSDFSVHWAAHRAAGEKMPAALVLGGDPAGLIAAYVETPADTDALHAAGLVRGKALEVVKCRTHGLEVPADADFVLEGYFDPAAPCQLGQENGAGESHRPVSTCLLNVTANTHRSHPIFPISIDAGTRGERAVLLKVRERMLLPAVRAVAPDVVDLSLPALGEVEPFAFVAVRQRYPYHARQIAAALWGSNMLRFTKFLVLLDADVDVHNFESVLAHIGSQVAPERDVFWLDSAVHRADRVNTMGALARHLAIDATRKTVAHARRWPSGATLPDHEEIRQRVTARWAEYQLNVDALAKGLENR